MLEVDAVLRVAYKNSTIGWGDECTFCHGNVNYQCYIFNYDGKAGKYYACCDTTFFYPCGEEPVKEWFIGTESEEVTALYRCVTSGEGEW